MNFLDNFHKCWYSSCRSIRHYTLKMLIALFNCRIIGFCFGFQNHNKEQYLFCNLNLGIHFCSHTCMFHRRVDNLLTQNIPHTFHCNFRRTNHRHILIYFKGIFKCLKNQTENKCYLSFWKKIWRKVIKNMLTQQLFLIRYINHLRHNLALCIQVYNLQHRLP